MNWKGLICLFKGHDYAPDSKTKCIVVCTRCGGAKIDWIGLALTSLEPIIHMVVEKALTRSSVTTVPRDESAIEWIRVLRETLETVNNTMKKYADMTA